MMEEKDIKRRRKRFEVQSMNKVSTKKRELNETDVRSMNESDLST